MRFFLLRLHRFALFPPSRLCIVFHVHACYNFARDPPMILSRRFSSPTPMQIVDINYCISRHYSSLPGMGFFCSIFFLSQSVTIV